MSTLANITSLNLSLQTGGAALAVNAVKSVAKPARTVYVFGTADDVAPNFTTVAGAITYANSLLPNEDNPVVVRLFANDNNEPYTLAGLSSWTTYANSYIYFVSDFVRLNETTTLPTTLPAGQQVWYIDANGVETLWVGRENGSAWPAVGYKEYVALLSQTGTSAPVATVLSNMLGTVTPARSNVGQYSFSSSALFTSNKTVVSFAYYLSTIGNSAEEAGAITFFQQDSSLIEFNTLDPSFVNTDGILLNQVTIRVYP